MKCRVTGYRTGNGGYVPGEEGGGSNDWLHQRVTEGRFVAFRSSSFLCIRSTTWPEHFRDLAVGHRHASKKGV